MKITLYNTLLDDKKLPSVVRESCTVYNGSNDGSNGLTQPQMIADMMNAVFNLNKQAYEHVYQVCMTSKSEVLGVFLISKGGIGQAFTSTRAVLQNAFLCNANTVIMVHNHPSGIPTPSADDLSYTCKLAEAGKIVDVAVVDHIIIGDSYFSLAEHNLL